jgi:hypothetical protein
VKYIPSRIRIASLTSRAARSNASVSALFVAKSESTILKLLVERAVAENTTRPLADSSSEYCTLNCSSALVAVSIHGPRRLSVRIQPVKQKIADLLADPVGNGVNADLSQLFGRAAAGCGGSVKRLKAATGE